jgi:alpha-L-rhamnosidase
LQIPVNAEAVFYIPVGQGQVITEQTLPAEKAEGVRFVKREETAAIYEIGSGSYHFVVDNRPLSISPPRPPLVTPPANTN